MLRSLAAGELPTWNVRWTPPRSSVLVEMVAPSLVVATVTVPPSVSVAAVVLLLMTWSVPVVDPPVAPKVNAPTVTLLPLRSSVAVLPPVVSLIKTGEDEVNAFVAPTLIVPSLIVVVPV